MSKVIPFPPAQPADPTGELRAALAACDMLMRAEAILMTAGVMARDSRLKAHCLFAQDAALRARQRAEELLVTLPRGEA